MTNVLLPGRYGTTKLHYNSSNNWHSNVRVATVFLYANSSRFQHIFKHIYKMLSIIFQVLLVGKILPKARFVMAKGHCCIQSGVWGCCNVSPPAGLGQSLDGGPRGEGPASTEDLAFYNIKNRLKNHLCCAFFFVLLCVL